MKNLIKFIIFIFYSTTIFFLPNNIVILVPLAINLLCMIIVKSKLKRIFKNLLNFLPFILFTAIINCILDNYINAMWIGIKLLLVCNITFIYASTTTTARFS